MFLVVLIQTFLTECEEAMPQPDFDDVNPVEMEGEEDSNVQVIQPQQMRTGDFLLAKFKGGHQRMATYRYRFVVQALQGFDEEDPNIRVQGYRSINRSRTKFVVSDNDTPWVSQDEILEILHQPKLVAGFRVIYEFPKTVDVKEN